MRQARTCRAQVLLVHISIKLLLIEAKAGLEVSSNGCLLCSYICYKVLPGALKALTVYSHGGPLLHGVEVPLPPGCPLPMPPKHSASHIGSAADPQTAFIQSSLHWLRVEAMLAQY